MPRRKFTREFKVSAVKLVNEQGYSVPEAARSLGVDPNCVRGWVGKFSSEAGLAPSGEGAMAAELRVHRRTSDGVSGGRFLRCPGGEPLGILRLVAQACERASPASGGTGGEDPEGA